MASRWIRWHLTTHIWEYSTDNGSNWAPLPLNAAVLTEGTINPARLPAEVPLTNENSVFTGTIPITLSGTTPQLTFYETDQSVGGRSSRIVQQNGFIYFQKQDDAGGGTGAVNLAMLTRYGFLSLYPVSSGVVFDITAPLNNALVLRLRNTDPGTNRYAGIQIGNDIAEYVGSLFVASSGWSAGGFLSPSVFTLEGNQSAGLNLVASHGLGKIRFFTGGNVTPSGWWEADGNLHVYRAGVVEKGRTIANGIWIDIPYNAANFTANSGAWTTVAGNQISFRYTWLSGNTLNLSFDIRNTSVSAITQYLFIKVPEGKTLRGPTMGAGVCQTASGHFPMAIFGIGGDNRCWITPNFLGAWPVGGVHVAGSIILDI